MVLFTLCGLFILKAFDFLAELNRRRCPEVLHGAAQILEALVVTGPDGTRDAREVSARVHAFVLLTRLEFATGSMMLADEGWARAVRNSSKRLKPQKVRSRAIIDSGRQRPSIRFKIASRSSEASAHPGRTMPEDSCPSAAASQFGVRAITKRRYPR
ncbi:hypothetical protein [Actinoplanes sp. NPDC026619]|uniref:hypothetical protein n=1 Tax=Actinoplanes sp. NPDC026619 TaxID=3155798 RepID=UPI0033C91073